MQFSQTSGASTPFDLIPAGFLCWVMLTFRGMKSSGAGGRYGDLELTVADNQPYARKKLWTRVGDPDFQGNSEKYRNMGMTQLTRMIEAAGFVDPKDPNSYQKMNGMTCEQVLQALDGKYIAIKVKVEEGEGGYSDKNDVADYLTPNEQSSGFKNFQKLSNRDHGLGNANPAARAGGGFGMGGPAAPPSPSQNQHVFAPHNQGGQAGGAGAPFGQGGMTTSRSDAPPPQPARTGFDPNTAPAFLQQPTR